MQSAKKSAVFCCFVLTLCIYLLQQSTYCAAHIPKNEKDNELTTLSVFRRVYVNRDENRQVATVMHQDHNNLLRVGSLIFLSVGQLLPHQLQAFHTPNYIYPIGYKIVSLQSDCVIKCWTQTSCTVNISTVFSQVLFAPKQTVHPA